MAKTRRNNMRKNNNRRVGGYLTDQQYFDPDVYPPASLLPPIYSAPADGYIRPVMLATAPTQGMMTGGARTRGGFAPSVMGSFVANAQTAIVPAALYLVYNQFVPKNKTVSAKLRKALKGGRRSRRSRRHSRR